MAMNKDYTPFFKEALSGTETTLHAAQESWGSPFVVRLEATVSIDKDDTIKIYMLNLQFGESIEDKVLRAVRIGLKARRPWWRFWR